MKQTFQFSRPTMMMRLWVVSGGLMFGSVSLVFSQAITSDVFRAQAVVQGVIQSGPTPISQTIQPLTLNSEDLVNLALGRERGTKLQANEVLAYASSLMTNTTKLLVFDSAAVSNLATIGQIAPQNEVIGRSHRRSSSEMISEMTVPGAGNATNGLLGGSLLLDVRSVLETNGAVMKLSAKTIGFLRIVVQTTSSSTVVGTNLNVLVRTATITTRGKPVGTLIEQP